MRVAVFSSQHYERALPDEANLHHGHDLVNFDTLLGPETDFLSAGFLAVSVFVNDIVDANVLKHLADHGTKLVATHSTGINHIDIQTAERPGVKVARVTDYSPNSVAEFAVGLLLALTARFRGPTTVPETAMFHSMA